MKKLLLICFSTLLLAFLAACGAEEQANEEKTNEATTETAANEETQEKTDNETHKHSPLEPDADTVCDSCNMVVYQKDHEFGVFTAQGVTKDGENVFFDDIGCLMNYERKNGEALAVEWIRDYETLEWTERDKAVPVKTNKESPMNWGYIMFADAERAEAFAADEENSKFAPEVTDWTVVDNAANERFQKKMQAQKQAEEAKNNHEHEEHMGH